MIKKTEKRGANMEEMIMRTNKFLTDEYLDKGRNFTFKSKDIAPKMNESSYLLCRALNRTPLVYVKAVSGKRMVYKTRF